MSRGNALKFWSSVGPVLQLCISLGSLVQADNQPSWSQCSHVYNGLVTGQAAPAYSRATAGKAFHTEPHELKPLGGGVANSHNEEEILSVPLANSQPSPDMHILLTRTPLLKSQWSPGPLKWKSGLSRVY